MEPKFEIEQLEARLEMQVITLPDGTTLSEEEAAKAAESCTENCGCCAGSECLTR